MDLAWTDDLDQAGMMVSDTLAQPTQAVALTGSAAQIGGHIADAFQLHLRGRGVGMPPRPAVDRRRSTPSPRARGGPYGSVPVTPPNRQMQEIAREMRERLSEECMDIHSAYVEINNAGAAVQEHESVRERGIVSAISARDEHRARPPRGRRSSPLAGEPGDGSSNERKRSGTGRGDDGTVDPSQASRYHPRKSLRVGNEGRSALGRVTVRRRAGGERPLYRQAFCEDFDRHAQSAVALRQMHDRMRGEEGRQMRVTQRAREAGNEQQHALLDWSRRAEAAASADQGRLREELASATSEIGEFSRRPPPVRGEEFRRHAAEAQELRAALGQAEAKLVDALTEKAASKPEPGFRPARGLSSASGGTLADAENWRLRKELGDMQRAKEDAEMDAAAVAAATAAYAEEADE